MLALIRRDILVDAAELAFYHGQTLVDEVSRGDRHLIAVLKPLFVVDGDHAIEQIDGAFRRIVRGREVDCVAAVTFESHAKLADKLCGGRRQWLLVDVDRGIFCRSASRQVDHDIALGRADSVAGDDAA